MKKYILFISLLFFSTYLQAQDNLKFYIKKALTNNLQLNAKEKVLNLQSKVKIFQEVNSYQASLFQEIKRVLLLQIRLIKAVKV